MTENVVRSASESEGAGGITFPEANVVAVGAIAGAMETALGPSSRDKLVIEKLATRAPDPGPRGTPPTDEYVVTSDGATLMEALPIEHPIGPVVERVVGPEQKGDTDVVGAVIPDGVTSSLVLLGALLEEGQALIDRGLHPYSIRSGYELGLQTARETLESASRPVDSFADVGEIERAVARSAMTGNDLAGAKDRWAALAVEAVSAVGYPDEVTFAVRTVRDGSIDDSRLVRGAVLDRNQRANEAMPRRVEDATVLALGAFSRKGGLQDPKVPDDVVLELPSPDGVADLEAHWEERREWIVERLVETGVDVVVARSGISRAFQSLLAERGIMGIRAVNQLNLRQVAAATGARIVNDPHDIDPAYFGRAGVVSEQLIEPRMQRRKRRRMIVFEGCTDPSSVALLLRGVSGQVADQAETELRKAAAAVAAARGERGRRPGVVPGGGAADVAVAAAVRNRAREHDSRAQLALEAFADAAEHLPWTIARNGATDPHRAVADLRSAAANGDAAAGGIALPGGEVVDAVEAGILDPVATRIRVYETAVEVANVVLNVDDAIDAVHTEEPPDPDDALYEDAAEQMRDHQKSQADGR